MKISLGVLLLVFSLSAQADHLEQEQKEDMEAIMNLAVKLFIKNSIKNNFDWSNRSCEVGMMLYLESATKVYYERKKEILKEQNKLWEVNI